MHSSSIQSEICLEKRTTLYKLLNSTGESRRYLLIIENLLQFFFLVQYLNFVFLFF